MKVTNELERILLETQNTHTSNTKKAGAVDFGNLLDKQFKSQEMSGEGIATLSLANQAISTFSGAEKTSSLGDISGTLLESMEDSLEIFTTYTNSVNTDPKNAWKQLDTASSKLSSLRQSSPNLAEENPTLDAMLNELEVLAVTEKFKFNRGDYH